MGGLYLILFLAFALQVCHGASFINCNESLPITLQFKFPDPMVITVGDPFHFKGGSVVREAFPSRFKIKHKMQRKFLGKWWTIPCVGKQDSVMKPFYKYENLDDKPCYHEMSCDEFLYMGFNGTCPIQPGVYKDYNLTIPVPYFPVPWWLTNGLYRAYIEAYDMDLKTLWFCGSLTQYFEQSHEDQKRFLAEVIV